MATAMATAPAIKPLRIVTIQKTVTITRLTIPIIKFSEFFVSKIYTMNAVIMIDKNPDSTDCINVAISNPITQCRCSPAVAPVKSAPLRIALVKFAPLISALLKFAPVRF